VKNIKHLLDVVDGVRDHVALGLMSDPGLSKTAQVKQWAEENGRTYCELIISQRMPSEISGMPMPVSDSRTMEIFDFQTLLNLQDGDVLAFDEFTNGNIQTLNACLTLIQERTMLSGKKLPSLVIVAMGNPQGRCELLPQTKQRFWWVDVVWDAPTWTRYMHQTWGIQVSKTLTDAISDQYQRGFAAATEYNYMTPRTVENLFRIATNIKDDEPFWEVSNLPTLFVTALYDSMSNTSTFKKVADKIGEWFESENENPTVSDDVTKLAFMTELLDASSIVEFREFLQSAETRPEYAAILPEFMAYLKSTGLDEKVKSND